MKNFIFKSKDKTSDLFKISLRLEHILTEQRHQRSDLAHIIEKLDLIYSVPKETEHIPEEELED